MSTQRVVPRYPELNPDFEEWAEMGHKEVGGVIDIANKRWKGGYIKPIAFPEQRLFFAYPKEWGEEIICERMVGRAVVFDVPPTDVIPGGKVQAFNVRLA